ncbi:519_t:CDS:2 [Acaulospora morrowiae]|uniref:519_t:CDS:1 n=1 Tax=Acaulospora morrowiae TaxID=94023 RepID=A0A9N9CL97_9GLOM|nr:519_t:CDS:2 [Acaulospora morrowiae]
MTQRNVPRLHVSVSVTLHTANEDEYKIYTLIATLESFPPHQETSSYMIFRSNDKDHVRVISAKKYEWRKLGSVGLRRHRLHH